MERNREIYKVTLVGGVVNVLLLLFKFIAGIMGHSAAMVADAVHSLSDFLTDIVVLIFVRISSKPKDKTHEYGHGKYETLAMTLIGMALLVVAIGIIYNGLTKIVSCVPISCSKSILQCFAKDMLQLRSNLIFPIVPIGFFLLMKLFQNLLIHGIGSQPKLSFVLSLLPHALHA